MEFDAILLNCQCSITHSITTSDSLDIPPPAFDLAVFDPVVFFSESNIHTESIPVNLSNNLTTEVSLQSEITVDTTIVSGIENAILMGSIVIAESAIPNNLSNGILLVAPLEVNIGCTAALTNAIKMVSANECVIAVTNEFTNSINLSSTIAVSNAAVVSPNNVTIEKNLVSSATCVTSSSATTLQTSIKLVSLAAGTSRVYGDFSWLSFFNAPSTLDASLTNDINLSTSTIQQSANVSANNLIIGAKFYDDLTSSLQITPTMITRIPLNTSQSLSTTLTAPLTAEVLLVSDVLCEVSSVASLIASIRINTVAQIDSSVTSALTNAIPLVSSCVATSSVTNTLTNSIRFGTSATSDSNVYLNQFVTGIKLQSQVGNECSSVGAVLSTGIRLNTAAAAVMSSINQTVTTRNPLLSSLTIYPTLTNNFTQTIFYSEVISTVSISHEPTIINLLNCEMYITPQFNVVQNLITRRVLFPVTLRDVASMSSGALQTEVLLNSNISVASTVNNNLTLTKAISSSLSIVPDFIQTITTEIPFANNFVIACSSSGTLTSAIYLPATTFSSELNATTNLSSEILLSNESHDNNVYLTPDLTNDLGFESLIILSTSTVFDTLTGIILLNDFKQNTVNISVQLTTDMSIASEATIETSTSLGDISLDMLFNVVFEVTGGATVTTMITGSQFNSLAAINSNITQELTTDVSFNSICSVVSSISNTPSFGISLSTEVVLDNTIDGYVITGIGLSNNAVTSIVITPIVTTEIELYSAANSESFIDDSLSLFSELPITNAVVDPSATVSIYSTLLTDIKIRTVTINVVDPYVRTYNRRTFTGNNIILDSLYNIDTPAINNEEYVPRQIA